VIRPAQYDAQCADCGGKISAGQQMEYLPPSGEFAARTSHPGECPEPKPKKARGVNNGQRLDPEAVKVVWRDCDACGSEWTVNRTALASKRSAFVAPCCDGRHGEETVTHVNAQKLRERQKAAA